MTKTTPTRKARFKAALALAGITQTVWAKENGVTQGHLSQTLAGIRESKTLTEKVDAFIVTQERKAAKRYGAFLRDFKASAA